MRSGAPQAPDPSETSARSVECPSRRDRRHFTLPNRTQYSHSIHCTNLQSTVMSQTSFGTECGGSQVTDCHLRAV